MNKVTIMLANKDQFFINMAGQFSDKFAEIVARKLDNYDAVGSFYTEARNTNACEEAFDLSNNPGRHEERARVQGHTRTLSVGDVVVVEHNHSYSRETVKYVCMDMGWEVLA